MSLVPSLTVSRKKRDHLNNKRNTFTFVANLSVLGIALILFELLQDSLTDFEILGCLVVGIGSITSAIFVFSIDETKLTRECEKQTEIIREILAISPDTENKEDAKYGHNSTSFTTWRYFIITTQ
jgi:Na+/melibiose symporter-like transporter